jgi:hypothetical protein
MTPEGEDLVVPPPPQVLQEAIQTLEHWARRNDEEANKDGRKFWVLKLPAILVSASSGLLAHLRVEAGIAAGVLASVCILLDGLIRAGDLRSVHLKAVAEIKLLKHEIQGNWTAGYLRGGNLRELVAGIVEDSEKEKRRIAAYLKAAEASIPHSPVRGR